MSRSFSSAGSTDRECVSTARRSQRAAEWRSRFLEQGVAGMYARHKGRKPTATTPRMQARILSWTQRKPEDGSTLWTTRKLGT